MNRITLIILLLTATLSTKAQINELGVFVGGANYIGDVGPTNYIAPSEPAVGILYKWNRSPRHAYRASFTYGDVFSDDADSDVSGRNERGYAIENTIKELSLGLEFNFFDFNLHEAELKITPYVYSGVSYFWHNEMYISNGVTRNEGTKGAFAIPMTVGVKTNAIGNFIIGLEVGARYTFTDNIDGSNPGNDAYSGLRFGNLNSKDWYVFSGLTVTYTFGEKPCYCPD